MNSDLFRAILAMDSYNRGYGAGLGNNVAGLGGDGSLIGTATVSSQEGGEVAQAAGFYAIAYTLASGEKVISYRGTDGLPLDVLSYPLMLGNYNTEQARLAAQFYLGIATEFGSQNVSLTGHSLGGGLAGFIGGLYGSSATVFDNMPFELSLITFAADIGLGLNADWRANFTSGSITPSPSAVGGNLSGYYVEGEFIQLARLATLQQTPMTVVDVGTGFDLPGVDDGSLGGNRHSISLLVLGQFADGMVGTSDWREAAQYFMTSLFDDSIGEVTGAGFYRNGEFASYADVMRDAIAYSAIDEGTRVFGDTGIRALFDDAHRRLDQLTAQLASAQESEPGQVKQHDAEILASLPGVGRIVLATLLAEAWDALQRRDYAALRSLTGVAPVTKRSGKSCIVIRRQACNDRLANAMYHWARVAVQHDRTCRAKYAALRGRGHSHGRALRSVADRLLNVACAMLKTRTTFNPSLAAEYAPC